MEPQASLGIIGGSGLYGLHGLENVRFIDMETPFGRTSEPVRIGSLNGQKVAFISRHSDGHTLSPSAIPYAANICALKMLGVQRVVSISAVGSLKEELAPRSFVVPDNIIDRTMGRQCTFFEKGVVAHVSLADPFCPILSDALEAAARAGGLPVSRGGVYVCIEGPQFSTRAESHLYRSWGASLIGMTAMPEARLAREAELCYACLAMVTDFDVWHDSEAHVSVESVLENLFAMTGAVEQIVPELAAMDDVECDVGCRNALSSAIITRPDAIREELRLRLNPIAGRYLTTEDHPRD
jgi:5'-methylthioadenosine phosphorylase